MNRRERLGFLVVCGGEKKLNTLHSALANAAGWMDPVPSGAGEGYNEALALIQGGPQEAGERAAVQGPRARPLPQKHSGGPPRYHHVSLDGFS